MIVIDSRLFGNSSFLENSILETDDRAIWRWSCARPHVQSWSRVSEAEFVIPVVCRLKMPSVITKPQENGAASQSSTLEAALAIVEKKVRNLEKRKVSRVALPPRQAVELHSNQPNQNAGHILLQNSIKVNQEIIFLIPTLLNHPTDPPIISPSMSVFSSQQPFFVIYLLLLIRSDEKVG